MLDFGFYNMDCMQGMKEFPDKYFDLAIVDPPYGAGFTEVGGCQGWFSKYHQNAENLENLGGGTTGTDLVKDSTGTKSHYVFGLRKTDKNYQKMKEDMERKKSYRGTLPLEKNTLKSFFASHGIRLYGAAITFHFHRQGALLCGVN